MAVERGCWTTVAASVCAVLGGLLYLNTLNCEFAFDDKAVIIDNNDLRPDVSWLNILRNDFWGTPMSSPDSHKSYRPLTVATFRLNYMLHELQPLGYHLVNVLLHSAVCYLYVLLCGVVFSEVWPALIAGLLFAVHPIHTEAVAGLVGRAELLSCVFFLLSIYYYIKAVRCKKGSLSSVLWSVVCVVCSLVSKEQGVMVVGVCVVYDLFIANQVTLSYLLFNAKSSQRWSAMWKRTALMAVFTVSVLGVRFSLMKNRPVFNPLDNEGLYLDPPYRQLHWAYLIFINTWLLINPSSLIHDYRMGAIPLLSTFTDPRHALTVVTFITYLVLGLFSLGLFRRNDNQQTTMSKTKLGNGRLRANLNVSTAHMYTRSERMLLFGLALLIFPFLPASNLFMTVGFVVAERILYIPSLGICFIVAYGISVLLASSSKGLRFFAVLGLVLLLASQSAKVLVRNPDWTSKLTLYEAGVHLYPHNGNLLGNIGLNYRKRGDSQLAEKVYRYSMQVAPDSSLSFMNFGIMLREEGRLKEAEEVLKQAADIIVSDPTVEGRDERKAKVHVTVGNMIANDDSRLEEALRYISKGVEIDPSLPNAHNSKGSILHKMGRIQEAKVAFEDAIRLNPNYANAHYNLGLMFYSTGNDALALKEFQTTLKIDPNHQLARLQLQHMRESGHISAQTRHS